MIAKNILLVLILLFTTGCFGLRLKTSTYKVVTGFSSPESVIADSQTNHFFVSNVGKKLQPSKKDGDGYISELSSDGIILNKRFLPKEGTLNAPKGMAIVGRTLYVTDVDKVVGFNLDTRDKIFELDFSSEKTVFLNDLTVLDEKTILVSATDTGKIYEISIGEKPVFNIIAENIPGVNGLYYDEENRELYVVSRGDSEEKGRLGRIKFNKHNLIYRKLTDPIGRLDGVKVMSDAKILISDWVAFDKPGLIRVYDIISKELSVMNTSEEVHGPADFYFDSRTNRIWLPKMKEGKILIEQVR